jgi:hypothetical protein
LIDWERLDLGEKYGGDDIWTDDWKGALDSGTWLIGWIWMGCFESISRACGLRYLTRILLLWIMIIEHKHSRVEAA